MFTPFARLSLLVLCIILSTLGAIYNIWPLLIISTLFSILILWGYYRNGTVYLALNKTRKNQFEKATSLLDQIKNPDRLNKSNRSYYYFIRGIIAHEENQFEASKVCLQESLSIGIKNESDRAMALLALADMELVEKKTDAAKVYFLQLKNLKVNKALMPSIRKMQEWLGV